jgi:tetratricopeptide (TPR) repeat protein
MSSQDPPADSQAPTRTNGKKTPAGSQSPEASAPPQRLGDFELLREIGRGGMGIVYEAQQISLKRRVALKVLPPGLGLTQSAIQRFEREAQAAAKLHHTNIVPVYAIGAEGDCHFYAMELIEGRSLAQILADVDRDERQALEGEIRPGAAEAPDAVEKAPPTAEEMQPREEEARPATGVTRPLEEKARPSRAATQTLKEEELTRLFGAEPDEPEPSTIRKKTPSETRSGTSTMGRKWFQVVAQQLADVADALEHAHSRGVIHRDIKPANLLLSPEGRLCITDFGLARVAQEPGMTTTGAFLGTPAYTSPEQARGRKVDHRADIYSLGVVLYEMLTLQRPFPGDSWEEIIHAILARDPARPRRINPRIPLDLETICLKAMEKEQERRYQSAGELAGDLRQYVHGGLITARRASLARRAWKAIRRHPVAAITAVAAVLILAIGGYAWRVSVSQSAEAARRAVADARLAMSEGEYREALGSVDEALARDAGLWEARLLRTRLLMELDRGPEAVDEANALLEQNPDDWETHLILATVAKGAWDAVGAVPTISAQEHVRFVESKAPETADAYYLRSLVADAPSEALELLDRAIELDPGHPGALVERVRRYEQLKDYPAAMEECDRLVVARPRSPQGRRLRAWLYRETGDFLGALAEMEEAVRLDPEDPANYDHRARAQQVLGKLEDAIEDVTRAIELNPDHARYHWRRASYLADAGRFEEAVSDARRALEIDPDLPFAYLTLMNAHYLLGQVDEARAVLSDLIRAAERWLDPESRVWAHRLIARAYLELEEPESALAAIEQALAIAPEDTDALFQRAWIRTILRDEAGRDADCAEFARIVLDSSREPLVREASSSLAGFCFREEQAEEGLDRVIEDYPRWWSPYHRRALLHLNQGRLEEALADCEKVIELVPRFWMGYQCRAVVSFKLGRPTDDLAKIVELNPYRPLNRMNLADGLFYDGKLEESLAQLGRALELSPRLAGAHAMRARVLAYQGRCQEARQALEKAQEIGDAHACSEAQVQTIVYGCPDAYDPPAVVEMARHVTDASPHGAQFWTILGAALYYDKQYEEARTALLKSVELAGRAKDWDLLLLSMASSRLGERSAARSYYEQLLEQSPDIGDTPNPVLINYHREAVRLLDGQQVGAEAR